MITIDIERCNACKLCAAGCPFGAIAVEGEAAAVDERCTLCGACVGLCPRQAIAVEHRKPSPESLAAYRGVAVWAECGLRDGRLVPKKVAYELLSVGRRLADRLGQPLWALVLGDGRLAELERLGRCGADRVLCHRHELLGNYSTDGFTSVIAAAIAKEKPSVFLCGATPNGRDLAPRVASRLRLGLTADCTALSLDEKGRLLQTRPAFGGNIMATIVAPYTRPQMATVRPNVFAAGAEDPGRRVPIENMPVTLSRSAIRTRLIEETCLPPGEKPIEEARIIVSAGRGIGSPANLDVVRTLAARLGATLTGSRAIVELGWIPQRLQVGQSGTTVSPELYIAVGISGAVQHVAGMRGSGKIIAVNTDPEAPIFKIADLGIVGDAMAIMPKLIAAIENTRSHVLECGMDPVL